MISQGKTMYQWATDLYPICRSLTGKGVQDTLAYINNLLPALSIHEVASGTKAFDWTIPDEWNIRDAFIADEKGNRLIDFKQSNLHVLGYSEPVDQHINFAELDQHLYSLPDQPDAIPYMTSYYKRRWGFCLSDNQRKALRQKSNATFHVKIDATLAPGHLTYGELIIPGQTQEEILLSTYVCHPSLANNELSGPCVATALAQWIGGLAQRRYTYRILFLPETIGAIVYLSRHLAVMKKNIVAGFVLTCMGDDRTYSYVASRLGDTLADRVAKHVLSHHAPQYQVYSFLDRGSDERQYCSPGVDLPVCLVIRSKYGTFSEYHTSRDDLSLISPQGLQGGFDAVRKCLEILENNYVYETSVLGEPQLGKRGLYPTLSTTQNKNQVRHMMDLLAYADGTQDLIGIAETMGVPAHDLIIVAEQMLKHGVMVRKAISRTSLP